MPRRLRSTETPPAATSRPRAARTRSTDRWTVRDLFPALTILMSIIAGLWVVYSSIDSRLSGMDKRLSAHDTAVATLTIREDGQQSLLSEVRVGLSGISQQITDLKTELARRGR